MWPNKAKKAQRKHSRKWRVGKRKLRNKKNMKKSIFQKIEEARNRQKKKK